MLSPQRALREHVRPDLVENEQFLTGAAARTPVGNLPVLLLLRGYWVAATNRSLLLYAYDKATSRPGTLVRRIPRETIRVDKLSYRQRRGRTDIDIPIDNGDVVRLVFPGAQASTGVELVRILSSDTTSR